MSLVSIRFKGYYSNNGHYLYTIMDNELGEIEVGLSSFYDTSVGYTSAIVKAYSKLNLSVSKNLALAIIQIYKDYGISVNRLVAQQNHCCPRSYVKERDEYLEKLLPLL